MEMDQILAVTRFGAAVLYGHQTCRDKVLEGWRGMTAIGPVRTPVALELPGDAMG